MTTPDTASAHTPGPWKIGHAGIGHSDCRLIYSDYQRDEVAGATHYIAHCIYNEANARLIAAAPDLLEACEWLLFSMNADFEEPDAQEYARQAIAKAKGKAA